MAIAAAAAPSVPTCFRLWKACPRAAIEGSIRYLLTGLFERFWKSVLDDAWRSDPEALGQVRKCLDRLLSGTGLRAFYPEHVKDWNSNWLLIRNREDLITGRVFNVVRPGLREENGLRLQAIVEVE